MEVNCSENHAKAKTQFWPDTPVLTLGANNS